MRPTVGKVFAAILLALCIGVQLLEASGQWDRSIKDTNDEAIIVVAVLCIGAAVAAAGAVLARVRPAPTTSRLALTLSTWSPWTVSRFALAASCSSPPVSLRI